MPVATAGCIEVGVVVNSAGLCISTFELSFRLVADRAARSLNYLQTEKLATG